jgi:hypothetical protein
VFEFLPSTIKQEKEVREMQIGMEEDKLSLFSDDILKRP